MEELTSAIQKKYVDDITAKYPVQRIFIFLIYLIASYAYTSDEGFKSRVIEYLSVMKVSYIYDFETGLLSKTSVFQFISCIGFVYGTQICYDNIKKKCFSVLAELSDIPKIEAYIGSIKDNILSERSLNESINFFVSKDIAIQLEKHRQKLKSYHAVSEALLAISAALLIGILGFSYKDYLIVTIILIIIFSIQWFAFKYYITWFVPFYTAEKTLLGATIKFGDE